MTPTFNAHEIQRIVNPAVRPTDEQVRIIEAPLRPQLVVAGAGSGKTETMAMRVLWLVANHEHLRPASILGLTFTRKAAGELGERLRSRLRLLADHVDGLDPEEEPVSLTYNSFAERIVSEHGLRIGVDPDFRMLGQAGSAQLMSDILRSWPTALPGAVTFGRAAKKALHLAGQLAEHGLDLNTARDELEQFGALIAEAGDGNAVVRQVREANRGRIGLLGPIAEYAERKRDMGVLDFPDQLALATRIVTEVPEVVEQIREEYRGVLLDEFQDTSVIQMRLLSTIFHDHPVTAVGDPNQAIYGWRGASASSLENFLPLFHSGKMEADQALNLSTAWRNDRRILVAANRVASPLRTEGAVANSPVLRARPNVGEGEVRISYVLDQSAQTREVVDYVRAQRAERPDDTTIAVLCRRRADFLPVDAALREAGIPTQIIGLGGLLDQPIVSDLRAVLEVTDGVDASASLLRLLVRADIGTADLALLGQWAAVRAARDNGDRHLGLLIDAVDAPPEPGWSPRPGEPSFSQAAHDRVRLLSTRLRLVRKASGRGLVDLAERAIRIMGILDDAIADPLGTGARESLDAFIDVVADYESATPTPTLSGFLTWLQAAEEEEQGLAGAPVEPDPRAVQIMTIHAAKGLEWDCVVVYGLSDGTFPSHSAKKSVSWLAAPPATSGWVNAADELPYPLRGDRADLPDFAMDLSNGKTPSAAFSKWLNGTYKAELGCHAEREERRLAYVALTRAKRSELLVGAWIAGASTPKDPSRYLMEARAGLIADLEGLCAAGAPDGRADLEGLEVSVGEPPTQEQMAARDADRKTAFFPVEPGPSRTLIAAAATRVRAAIDDMRTDADVFDLLKELGDDERVADVTALLEERRLNAESRSMIIWQDTIAATSVSGFIEDPTAFASSLRRPMPTEPSLQASLGTVFHSWAERQLRQASAALWDEPIIGEDVLSPGDQKRLATMKDNFTRLDIVTTGRPIAVEEPFTLQAAGVSVSGRIDAVFEDADGGVTIIDWKSGMTPGAHTDTAKLRYFATQLRLYKKAWSDSRGVPLDRITAAVVFVASGTVMTLPEVERLAGLDPNAGIDQLVRDALDAQSDAHR